jgi:osmotically-inducible protein OsmY
MPPNLPTRVDARHADSDIYRQCRLLLDRLGPFANVKVIVSNGWVHLLGAVSKAADRWKVEQAIGRLDGLAGVSGQLAVAAAQT